MRRESTDALENGKKKVRRSPFRVNSMTLQKVNLNFNQLSLGSGFERLEDDDRALSQADRHQREEAARGALVQLYKENLDGWRNGDAGKSIPPGGHAPKWMESLLYLIDHGWPWRQAVFIAWSASPRTERWPETQELLATEVLGLTSDRVIAEWRRRNPAIETMVASLRSAMLMDHAGDALEALKKSAANPDYKNHPDRKLYFEMTGLYTPVSQVRALIATGKLRTKNDVRELSDEELLAMVTQGELHGAAAEALELEERPAEEGGDAE